MHLWVLRPPEKSVSVGAEGRLEIIVEVATGGGVEEIAHSVPLFNNCAAAGGLPNDPGLVIGQAVDPFRLDGGRFHDVETALGWVVRFQEETEAAVLEMFHKADVLMGREIGKLVCFFQLDAVVILNAP